MAVWLSKAFVALGALSVAALGGAAQSRDALPASAVEVPAAPAALLFARPFFSEKPIEFVIGGERTTRTKGWILVLEAADKRLLEPRDAPDFAIFVGDAIAQKVSSGFRSGKIVVMTPDADLATAPIFFGSRLVPDRATPATVAQETAAAKQSAIGPAPPGDLLRARKNGGPEPFRVRDMSDLWFETGPVILRYSPDEREMVESLRKD